MAGTNPGFNATAFKNGIRFAMKMGAPVALEDQATFYFKPTTSYPPGTRLDREGRPLDPTIPRTEAVTTPPVTIDVAIEFDDPRLPIGGAQELGVGRFVPTRVTLTLFEEDYPKIKESNEVRVGQDTYLIAYSPPPVALFNVGIRQLVAYSRDET